MKILHLSSLYTGNPVFSKLIEGLSTESTEQFVYVPTRRRDLLGKNQIKNKDNIEYLYEYILNTTDRFLFHKKINKLFDSIDSQLCVREFDIIHAFTLFSDGALAYKLNAKYDIPYTLNVRNTDINSFCKYYKHLLPLMTKILKGASKIILLSYAYKDKLFKYLSQETIKEIESRVIVIPNAIDTSWFTGKRLGNTQNNKKINLLFMGRFDKNKNVETLLRIIHDSSKNNLDLHLNLIGEGTRKEKYYKLIDKYKIGSKITFHGFISNHDEIVEKMLDNDIFIMLSKHETLGLVYIESMAKGIPIIYTKNEGIDGYFKPGEVGIAVDYMDVSGATKAIESIMKNYKEISHNCLDKSVFFSWENVIVKYSKVFNEIVNQSSSNRGYL